MSYSPLQKSSRALSYAGVFLEHAQGTVVPAAGKAPISKFESLDKAASDKFTTIQDPLLSGRYVSIRTLPQSAAEDAESIVHQLTRDGADRTELPSVTHQLALVRDKFLTAAEHLKTVSAGQSHEIIERNIDDGVLRIDRALRTLERL